MKVLVTGASGFLGEVLANAFSERYEVVATHGSRPVRGAFGRSVALSLEDTRETERLLRDVSPGVVLHAAAMTNIDACERDPERTRRVNVEATEAIARLGARLGFATVFFSTDQVFDGRSAPYDESAPTAPTSVYGRSKLDAEAALAAADGKWTTLRLSLVYGWGGFVAWMSGRLARREPVMLFTDQFRTPVHTASIADAALAAVDRRAWGEVFHVGGAERVSRVEFGERFADAFGCDRTLLKPVRMRDVPANLPRPRDTSLVTAKAERLLGWRPWGLDEGFDYMAAERRTAELTRP